jgi:hypothetical protein
MLYLNDEVFASVERRSTDAETTRKQDHSETRIRSVFCFVSEFTQNVFHTSSARASFRPESIESQGKQAVKPVAVLNVLTQT